MGQFVVIGLGKFGTSVAKALSKLNNEVLVIDTNEDNIDALEDNITYGLVGDSTHEDILESAGVAEVDAVIIGVSDFKTSIMTALICKEQGANIIIAKAKDEIQRKILRTIGVDKVIIPEEDSGYKLAHNLTYGDTMDMLKLGSDYEIAEIKAPKKWVGKSLIDLDIRNRIGLTVLALDKEDEFIGNPSAADIVEAGDTVLIFGKVQDVAKLNS